MVENNIKIDFDAFLRSFKQNKDGSFAFLLGAGASITSGIQSAEDCIWDWKKQIYISNNPSCESFLDIHTECCKKRIQNWLDEQGIYPKENAQEEYVFYAEKTFPISSDRTKYFKNLCFNKSPNIGYKLLCLLHKYGVLKSVWTTNFDGLVERAAHQANITPICVNLDYTDGIFSAENINDLLYVALHGDYKYSRLKNTEKELDSQQDTFVDRLKEYFVDKNLVVIGYSGRDKSLMNALTEAFARPGSGRLYWCGYGANLNENVESLLLSAQKSGRDAMFVETDGFDKTLISILQSTYSDDLSKSQEIRKLLEDTGNNIPVTPFSLKTSSFNGCAKTNLYPVVLPHDIFTFEIDFPKNINQWDFIKNKIKGKKIVAAPYKGKIFAYGYSEHIFQVFSNCLKGDVSRLPLSLDDIKNNPILKSIALKTLICGLSSSCSKMASISKHIIWNKEWSFKSTVGVYEAVKLDLVFLR